MTTDVRLTSGLTRTVFYYFFNGGNLFFGGNNEKNNFFPPLKSGSLGASGDTVHAYRTTGGTLSQNKHNRHTDSRFRLLEDNSPRDGRDS